MLVKNFGKFLEFRVDLQSFEKILKYSWENFSKIKKNSGQICEEKNVEEL